MTQYSPALEVKRNCKLLRINTGFTAANNVVRLFRRAYKFGGLYLGEFITRFKFKCFKTRYRNMQFSSLIKILISMNLLAFLKINTL